MKWQKLVRRLSAVAGTLTMLFLAAPTDAQAPHAQATPPPPAPPRSVQFPTPVERTLPNGLRVIVVERTNTPLVAAQLLIKNGGEVDPPQLSGLANLTADLLTKGTTSRTAPQIAEAIEALGGSLDSGARWDASQAIVNVTPSKFAAAMEILADVVRHPNFKDEEIERLRQQTLDELSVALGQPGSIARYVAARVVFGDSPYGHPLGGTPESIQRIKRDDIVKMHSTYYRPANAVLAIAGDITAKEAFGLAERYFGDWKTEAASPVTAAVMSQSMPAKARVLVIDKPDAGQAAVLVARMGIERKNPDYFRGLVANSVLTGYSGRLNQEIRIKRGLSYGAGSSLDTRRGVGPFVASAQTKNESGAQVASLLLGEVTKLSNSPVPENELTPRKAVLIGNFSRNLETVNGLVAQVASLALYGLAFDEINRFINNVQSITSNDVQRFAGSHLDAKGASIIVVGNAKAFLPELRQQYPDAEVISLNDLDLNSGSLRRAPAARNLTK
jgi:zinc protease